MQQFDATAKDYLAFLDNEYVSAALTLFLIVYAGVAAPKLPENVARLFDNPLVKFLVFFLIAYMARKNPTVAIIAAIGLMVSLHTLSRYKVNRRLVSMAQAAEETVRRDWGKLRGAVGRDISELRQRAGELLGDYPVEMEGPVMQDEGVPEAALADLQAESKAPPSMPPSGCVKTANYRDSFYPQYTNMKPDAYMARYSGNDISGYDPSADYASN